MSKLTIIAGDFPVGAGRFTIRNFTLPGDDNHYLCETVSANQVTSLKKSSDDFLLLLDTDEKTKEFIKEAKDDQIFFMVKLKDERRFIAATDDRTFTKIIKAVEKEAHSLLDLDITSAA